MTDYQISKRNETWGEPTEFECFVCAWLMFLMVISFFAIWFVALARC